MVKWAMKRISDIAEFRRGSFPQPYDNREWYDGIGAMPFVQVVDVGEDMRLVDDTKQKISTIAQPKSVFVPKGTIVVTLQGSIGRVAITQYDCYVDRTLAIFERFKIEINKIYFAFRLQDKFAFEEKTARGSTIKTITKEEFSELEIPLPPLPEQRRIAAALSDTDALIAALEKLITKKRAIKQGAMQELLTGKRRLPGFSGEWVETTIGELSEIRMCKRVFSEQTAINGEIPFYKIGTFGRTPDAYITRTHYEEYKEKYSFPNKGDILLSAAGTLGRTVVYDGKPAYFQDSNIVWLDIDKNKLCNEYLYHCYAIMVWASPEGSTISRLYNNIIQSTEIILPPTLEEQTAIASILSDMDAEIDKLTSKLNKLKNIKQGMMSELLTEKIRLLEEDTTNGEN